VRLVQKMLGHSSATVTLDTYAHVWESKEQLLRDDLDRAWEETKSRTDAPFLRPKQHSSVVELPTDESESGL
jgi:hypothetical protein